MPKKFCAPGLIVLLSAICLTSIVSAQTSWWRTYGGSLADVGNSVKQTADGGYIIAGATNSYGAGATDFYLIKTNASGDTLWTRVNGGTSDDWGSSVQQTTDGGYVIVGFTISYGAGNWDVYLTKTNAQGDTLWARTYGGSSQDEGLCVQQTTDGGYIITGATYSFGPGKPGYPNVYLIKANTSGDTLWTRTYGGTSPDWGNSVQQTADGGYIVAGRTESFGGGNSDVYLVKTSTSGDTLWTRTYGGTSGDWGNSVQQTTDGGYIVAGITASFGAGNGDIYLIKTNAQGDALWTRTYGGTSLDCGLSIQQTTDGGYIITGYTYSFGAGTPDSDNVYLIKTNTQGDTLWTRTFGGTNNDEGSSVQQTTDGGYVITGYTFSFAPWPGDVYLIKTDANGNVASIEEPLTRHPANPTRFLVQPNPFASLARVPGHETDVFALSDVTGRRVAICRGDRVGKGLRPGIYFLSPVGPRAGKAVTATIVKAAP